MTDPKRFTTLEERLLGFGEHLAESAGKQRLFLTGRGKSGTTWLGRIMGAHPQVIMKGERKLFVKNGRYVPLVRPFLEGDHVPTWAQFTAIRRELDLAGIGEELARLVHDYLIFRTADISGFTHLGDKIPLTSGADARFLIDRLPELFPGAVGINIIRDGRDVAVSTLFHSYRNAKAAGTRAEFVATVERRLEGAPVRVFDDQLLTRIATSWSNVVTNVADHATGWGDGLLTVRYEDLLADPAGWIATMLEHCRLEAGEERVDRIVAATSFSAMAQGRPAGQEDAQSFFRKGVAGDWENYFTESDTALFERVAGSALQRFGYVSG